MSYSLNRAPWQLKGPLYSPLMTRQLKYLVNVLEPSKASAFQLIIDKLTCKKMTIR